MKAAPPKIVRTRKAFTKPHISIMEPKIIGAVEAITWDVPNRKPTEAPVLFDPTISEACNKAMGKVENTLKPINTRKMRETTPSVKEKPSIEAANIERVRLNTFFLPILSDRAPPMG